MAFLKKLFSRKESLEKSTANEPITPDELPEASLVESEETPCFSDDHQRNTETAEYHSTHEVQCETSDPQPTPSPALPDVAPTVELPQEKPSRTGFFSRLKERLSKTSTQILGKLETAFLGKKVIDEDLLEEIEEIFLSADIGVKTTATIIDRVRESVKRSTLKDPNELKEFLRQEILRVITLPNPPQKSEPPLKVFLIIGVNGSGKTTSIGKLAHYYTQQGKKVLLAAADTFRAAAIEQLVMWGQRTGVDVIHHRHGSDPSAVAYDATKAALSRRADILLIDTAGRLHNKSNLMEELRKINRVLSRDIPDAPHETWLVLDGTSGQNALIQAHQFIQTVPITGFILTKLDSTSKGGTIIGIIEELKLPVKFIGIGEKAEDLRPFDPNDFVDAIFQSNKEGIHV